MRRNRQNINQPTNQGDSSMCPRSVFWATILKNIDFFFLPKNFQLYVDSILHGQVFEMSSVIASQMFIICDSYATMRWPIIGNKFYSILFYSILSMHNLRFNSGGVDFIG